jgi:hypothetical protein
VPEHACDIRCLSECAARRAAGAEAAMLWTLAVILIVLWLLGVVSSYTINGFIHILLVVAVIVVLVRLIQGRRVV